MLNKLIAIAQQAGEIILEIYQKSDRGEQFKSDQSLLTYADLESHNFIINSLVNLYPDIPIISEESRQQFDYDVRKNWQQVFLVDPLDGTKEFVNRNGEFTVNIALVDQGRPTLGVVYAPVLATTYYAQEGKGAYVIKDYQNISLKPLPKLSNELRIIASRSHRSQATQDYLDQATKTHQHVTTITAGSALKFGLIAEGRADIYPRFEPTMEWDTAAGHILVKEVGKQIRDINSDAELIYNKKELRNPGFIVE